MEERFLLMFKTCFTVILAFNSNNFTKFHLLSVNFSMRPNFLRKHPYITLSFLIQTFQNKAISLNTLLPLWSPRTNTTDISHLHAA